MTKKIAIIIFTALIFFAVLLVGTYLFFQKRTTVTPIKKLTEVKVVNWKTYQNKDFSFNYPGDWPLTTNKLSTKQFSFTTDNISDPSSPGTAINIQGGKIFGQNGKELKFEEIIKQVFFPAAFTGPTKLQAGNQVIMAYVAKSGGVIKNYLTIPIDGGLGNYYQISFDSNNSSISDYKSLFDQIIKTFKFNYAK